MGGTLRKGTAGYTEASIALEQRTLRYRAALPLEECGLPARMAASGLSRKKAPRVGIAARVLSRTRVVCSAYCCLSGLTVQ